MPMDVRRVSFECTDSWDGNFWITAAMIALDFLRVAPDKVRSTLDKGDTETPSAAANRSWNLPPKKEDFAPSEREGWGGRGEAHREGRWGGAEVPGEGGGMLTERGERGQGGGGRKPTREGGGDFV